MPYPLKKTNGSVLLTLNDYATDNTSTSLILAGRGVPNYGMAYLDNFVGLCENFSNGIAPISPMIGQLWFNSSSLVNSLALYDDTKTWQYVVTSNTPGVITTKLPITVDDQNGDESILGAGYLILTRRIEATPLSGPQILFETYNGLYASNNKTPVLVGSIGVVQNTTAALSTPLNIQVTSSTDFVIKTTNNSQLRLVDSANSYGVILRNTGSSFYLSLTDQNDPYGLYNTLIPIAVNLNNGNVNMSNNLTVFGSSDINTDSIYRHNLTVMGMLYANNDILINGMTDTVKNLINEIIADIGNTNNNLGLFVRKAGDTMTGPLTINGGNLTVNGIINGNSSANFVSVASSTEIISYNGRICSYTTAADTSNVNPCVFVYDGNQNAAVGLLLGAGNLAYIASVDGNGNYYQTRSTIDAGGNYWTAGAITATGDLTAFSDERLKENIETIPDALETVKKLRGVKFTRKDTKKKGIGVIAQELEKYLPELVQDNDGTLSVAYGNIVGLLIEAVKTLSDKVDDLEKKLQK
jgi:hypothetical protein